MKKSTKKTVKDPKELSEEGKKYFESGQVELSIKSFREALKINPEFYEGWFNLGVVYQKTNRFDEAIDCYNNNVKYYVQNPFALRNLALCYSLVGKKEKAMEIANILAKTGGDWRTYFNLGTTAQISGEVTEAIKNYKKAIELNPNFGLSWGQLYSLYARTCDWGEAEKLVPKIEKINFQSETGLEAAELPFGNISRTQKPKENLEIAKLKCKELSLTAFGEKMRFLFEKKPQKRKMRIGYVSSDFHDHATAHLITKMFNLHDRKKFQIIAYSHGVWDDSMYREGVFEAVDLFENIAGMTDKEAAIKIYSDAVDILVDLKGHTNGNRLGIFALRPAPVSVTYLGYPGTTGSNFMDYILADKVVIPKKDTKFFTEKIVYLPDTYQVNDDSQGFSKRLYKRSDFGLPETGVVFASFNQAFKVNQETFNAWMKILKKVPDSILWLYEKLPEASANLKKEAKNRGVDPKRLIFASRLNKRYHLSRLKISDIALDTFTYNGHTTTSDSLWAGVPVVTLLGKHFASRVSASLLKAIGLPELITKTEKEYVDLAVKLAKDPDKLEKLKKKLGKNKKTYPLFDTKRFTKNLEKAYKKMWQIHAREKSPTQIVIS